jgi:hypothetical protein
LISGSAARAANASATDTIAASLRIWYLRMDPVP